ncbi:MAG: hypothetical protein EA427_09725 [Spirochaetaceae bacterium]|nr:MAG: hypothetical protein EA427_09725 [Spirochaetaceae bacterium]
MDRRTRTALPTPAGTLMPLWPLLVGLLLAGLLLAATGCRSTPEEIPPEPSPAPESPPPDEPAPPPPPPPDDPPPPPEPLPQAPLEGPRWILDTLYGTSRIAAPPAGSVWVEFDPAGEDPLFRAFTGIEQLTGTYTAGPRDQLTIQSVRFEDLAQENRRFALYRQQLLENIGLVKGYYIQGAIREESRLFLYGGVGREEIVLAEFSVAATTEETEQ